MADGPGDEEIELPATMGVVDETVDVPADVAVAIGSVDVAVLVFTIGVLVVVTNGVVGCLVDTIHAECETMPSGLTRK